MNKDILSSGRLSTSNESNWTQFNSSRFNWSLWWRKFWHKFYHERWMRKLIILIKIIYSVKIHSSIERWTISIEWLFCWSIFKPIYWFEMDLHFRKSKTLAYSACLIDSIVFISFRSFSLELNVEWIKFVDVNLVLEFSSRLEVIKIKQK